MASILKRLAFLGSLLRQKPVEVEGMVRALNSGRYDEALLSEAGEAKPATPMRYADVKPFDYRRWADGKGIDPSAR